MESISAAQARIHRAAMRLFAEHGTTQIKMSELAKVAGVARGTIYNNLPNPETLFEDVAAQLSAEMNLAISKSFENIDDSAERIAAGIRLYVRRAHEEPDWGKFLCRFAFSSSSLRDLWASFPMMDMMLGINQSRYAIREDQLLSAIGLQAGAVLSSILLVREGHKTWRDAGSDAAELVLCALGVPRHEARSIAVRELPPLPKLND